MDRLGSRRRQCGRRGRPEVLHRRRAEQRTTRWQERYKMRADVEGTIPQDVRRCGLRRSRYRGLARTSLQHRLTGAAISLARIDAHSTDTLRARTRTSRFAALRPADQATDGAKQART
ncbi:transposase [Streptomyces atratus]|uniref:transposase n=1 Tax=Streptomyces atratus TaxID=1893 RepID=UPI003F6A3C1A